MVNILSAKISQKLFYLAKKTISNKIEAKKRQLELIDSIEFKKVQKVWYIYSLYV